ncbi:hypothetical protein [Marmoricola sp. RAF53]|uniref:hypothetical protein n=1 Tax=Marmoricola sp. RAF53 TaxID=3233059 RepID=UPI003F9CAE65
MNDLLRDDEGIRAACAQLDRLRAMTFRVVDVPVGEHIFWTITYRDTLQFSLTDHPPDIMVTATWDDMVRATRSSRAGSPTKPELSVQGSEALSPNCWRFWRSVESWQPSTFACPKRESLTTRRGRRVVRVTPRAWNKARGSTRRLPPSAPRTTPARVPTFTSRSTPFWAMHGMGLSAEIARPSSATRIRRRGAAYR